MVRWAALSCRRRLELGPKMRKNSARRSDLDWLSELDWRSDLDWPTREARWQVDRTKLCLST